MTAAQWRFMRATHADMPEDRFWGSVPNWCDSFNVPPIDIAVQFGFDMRGLESLIHYYRGTLPFGCHGARNVEAIYEITVEGREPADPHEEHLSSLLNRAGLL
jgi:hypothetical protein